MHRETLAVNGMSCHGCEQTVERALTQLDGVTRVDADHEAGSVAFVVEDVASAEDVRTAIAKAGYDVAGDT